MSLRNHGARQYYSFSRERTHSIPAFLPIIQSSLENAFSAFSL